MFRLPDFEGLWHIARQIDDRQTGRAGRLNGTASFTAQGPAALLYEETGSLHWPAQPPLTATQRHLWRAEGTEIAVSFADGQPFHRFTPGADEPEARHDCAPDLYLVCYRFGAWPDWSSQWRVSGPRKDYVMRTEYRRPR